MACGSTLGVSETSPLDERNRLQADSGRESTLSSWDIVDRAARFKTKVFASEEPEVITQPGYVHVRVRTADIRPVDCFLYDAPIITGQALVRLLRAAEIGIDYQRIRPEAVLRSGNNPLVVLAANYREEDSGEKDSGEPGKLFVGLVPRVKIPIVCSHEATTSSSLRKTIDSLSRGLEPSSDFSVDSLALGEHLQVFELWALYREGRPVGFRQWRAAQNEAGELSTLEIVSLLGAKEQDLTAIDVRVSEREDAEGLLLSEWLELLDGEPHGRAALTRVPQEPAPEGGGAARFSYRVLGLGQSGPVEKTLTASEPFRSAFFAHEEIQRVEGSGGETEFLSFFPNYHLDQGTRLHYRASRLLGAQKVGELEVGDSHFELLWERGQVTRRRELSRATDTRRRSEEGGGIESRLLLRLPEPGEGTAPAMAPRPQLAPPDERP
jgi:hypothetical protein